MKRMRGIYVFSGKDASNEKKTVVAFWSEWTFLVFLTRSIKSRINSYSPNQPLQSKTKTLFLHLFFSSSHSPLTSKTTLRKTTKRTEDEEAKALGLAKRRQPVPGADGGAHFSHSRLSRNGAVG